MQKQQPVTMTILVTEKTVAELEKIFENLDNSFGPMGSGGYGVRKHSEKKNTYIFKECDCAPAKSFVVSIRDGEIWTIDLAHYLAGALASQGIVFAVEYREFSDVTEARKAFQS